MGTGGHRWPQVATAMAASLEEAQQALEEAGERQRGIDRLIEVENQKLKGLAVLSPRPSCTARPRRATEAHNRDPRTCAGRRR